MCVSGGLESIIKTLGEAIDFSVEGRGGTATSDEDDDIPGGGGSNFLHNGPPGVDLSVSNPAAAYAKMWTDIRFCDDAVLLSDDGIEIATAAVEGDSE